MRGKDMDGVEDYFKKGEFEALYRLVGKFLGGKGITTKVDGAPAIVMWSEFPGLPGPGVSFKTIIRQTQNGNPKTVLTSIQQIDEFAREKEYDDETIGKRIDAFKYALKFIAPNVKPGVMLWGDTLFTPSTKKMGKQSVTCTPNTLTYEFDVGAFPGIERAKFGICVHSVVDGDFNIKNVTDANKFISGTSNDVFVLAPDQTRPEMDDMKRFRVRLEEANDMAMEIKDGFTKNIGISIGKAMKGDGDIVSAILSDKRNSDVDKEYAQNVQDAFNAYVQLKEDILDNCSTPSIRTYLDGHPDAGEGYVIMNGGKALKMVSTNFTRSNVQHMRKQQINEGVDGNYLKIWSSSRDSNLFKYFIDKQLQFGLGGGSQYGFALYGVVEPPWSDDTAIGYSPAVREKLYGENIFEFRIPTSKVLFLMFDEYRKTKEGRNAKFKTFIKDQIRRFGLDFTEEEIKYISPESPDENTSTQAMRLFKLCSRKMYQNKNGTLKVPFGGFVYKGKMDGKTFVGWNPYLLEPSRMSNDNGKTWKKVDRGDKEVVDLMNDARTDNDDENEIFDGNKTPKKEQAYRLLMAYNSNDGFDKNGRELSMSEGIFYNIVIHDNGVIDAKYRFQRPITDNYIHYFRPSENQFIDKLLKLGFKFGVLDCGLKLGSETQDAWTYKNVPRKYLPQEVTGGLELIRQTIDKEINIPCSIGEDKLVLIKCEILKDVFDGYDVSLTDNEKKLNWTTPELKQELVDKYEWAKPELLLDARPEQKKKTRAKKK